MGDDDESAIISIMPTCCFICNSCEAAEDLNQCIIESTGCPLSDVMCQLVPDAAGELQLLSAVCVACAALLTEYDGLRTAQTRLADHVRRKCADSQTARASLEVVINMGDNRVTVPYGVYREHRLASGAAHPQPAQHVAADEADATEDGARAAAEATPRAAPQRPDPDAAAEAADDPPAAGAASLDLEIHVAGTRTCHMCDAPFDRVRELSRHLRQAHQLSSSEIRAVASRAQLPHAAPAGGVVACPLCRALLASARRARAHLLLKHRAELEAGVALPPELALHLCRVCGTAFHRAEMCRKHEAAHRAQTPAHRCELCGVALRYRHGLKRHLQTRHRLSAGHPAVARASLPAAARQHCDRCSLVFADYGKYLFHYRSVHHDEPQVGFGCDACARRFEKRSELQRHCETHADTSYSCVTCEKHFKTRLAYQKHVRVHNGGGWKCSHCEKVFDSRPNLQTHLQTHSERRQHVCDQCGATFKFGQTLARHRTVRHSGDTPRYVCDVCGKAFALEHALNLHRSRHGPRELACQQCDMKFTNRPDMQRHLRRSHGGATGGVDDPLEAAFLDLTGDTVASDALPVDVTFEMTI